MKYLREEVRGEDMLLVDHLENRIKKIKDVIVRFYVLSTIHKQKNRNSISKDTFLPRHPQGEEQPPAVEFSRKMNNKKTRGEYLYLFC